MLILKKKISLLKITMLVAITAMPLYVFRFELFGIPTNAFEIMAVFPIFLGLFYLGERNLFEEKKNAKLLFILTATLLVGVIVSLGGSNFTLAGLGILKSWFVLPIVFSFLLLSEMKTENDFILVTNSIFLATFLVSLTALIYKFLGVVTFDGRLSAFYESPNYLAMFVAPGIICGIYLAYVNKKKSAETFSIILLALFLECLVLFFTQSYANWLGLFVTIVLVFVILLKSKKLLVALFLLFIFASILFASQLSSAKSLAIITNNPHSSLASRIMIWKASFLMLEKNPLVGIGPGNFQKTYLSLQSYFPPYLEWAVPQPHNLFLAFWLQTGLLGILSFVGILYFSINSAVHMLKNKKNAPKAIFLLAFFSYIVIVGIFDTPYWKNDLSFLFWILIALTIHANNSSLDQ